MLFALRRFRTTRATAILRTAGHAGCGPGPTAFMATAVIVGCLSCPGAAAPSDTTAGRLLAAGDAAAERGWYAAAREHWRDAAREASSSGDTVTRQEAAAHLAHLDAIAQDAARVDAARHRQRAAAWNAADWQVSWRVSAGATECGGDAAHPPIAITGGLVVWNTGRAVHAVALSDGRPAWRPEDGRDTIIFPRGIGGRVAGFVPACTLLPTAAACAGGRAYAVIDQGRDGQLLACLDLSDCAEGRLAWFSTAATVPISAPAGTVTFDGPPAVDHDVCAIVIRTDDARGSLSLAVFDPRDGSRRWVRSLGPAVSVDGIDRGRGHRQACLAEDRIVVATHAGVVHAFDRDGAVAWTASTPTPAAGGEACVAPASFAAGRVLVPATDGVEMLAFEPRHGGLLWRWRAGPAPVATVLGTCAGGVVIATRGHDDALVTTLRRLSIDDGLQTAEFAGNPPEIRAVGRGTIADGTVFWPVGSVAGTFEIEVLDAVTLQRRRRRIDCGPFTVGANAGSGDPQLAVAGGSLVIADGGLTCRRPAPAADGGPAADTSSR